MTFPAKPPNLQRTDVDGFLRTVGAELRAASEFLGRPCLPSSQAGTCSQLLQFPVYSTAVGHAKAWPPAADWAQAPGNGHAAASERRPSRAVGLAGLGGIQDEDAEVDRLLTMMQPAAAAPATCAPAAVDVPDEAHGARVGGGRAAEQRGFSNACAEPAGEQQRQHGQQPFPPARHQQPQPQPQPQQLRPGHAKVLSWLSSSRSAGNGLHERPADAIPALRPAQHSAAGPAPPPPAAAATTRPAAAFGVGTAGRHPSPPTRAPSSPARQRPLLMATRAAPALAPAPPPLDYCSHTAHPSWQGPKLTLARPRCSRCGREEAECRCADAGSTPLRLLLPRHPGFASPAHHVRLTQAGGCQGTAGPALHRVQPSSQRQPLAPVPPAEAAGQQGYPGSISIGNIHAAYFGGAGGSCQHAAPWQAPPCAPAPAAAAAAPLPLPAPYRWACGGTGQPVTVTAVPASRGQKGRGPAVGMPAGRAEADLWAPYLASRQLPAGLAGRDGSGPLAQLRAISQRIRGMQGDIASFLLGQHAGQAPALGQQQRQQRRQRQEGQEGTMPEGSGIAAGTVQRHGAVMPSTTAAAREQAAGYGPKGGSKAREQSAVQAGQRGSPFTDDAILTILTGTDFARCQQAALAEATGLSESSGGPDSSGKSGAVQRLKEVQWAAVTAVRVGRQVRAGQRAGSG